MAVLSISDARQILNYSTEVPPLFYQQIKKRLGFAAGCEARLAAPLSRIESWGCALGADLLGQARTWGKLLNGMNAYGAASRRLTSGGEAVLKDLLLLRQGPVINFKKKL